MSFAAGYQCVTEPGGGYGVAYRLEPDRLASHQAVNID